MDEVLKDVKEEDLDLDRKPGRFKKALMIFGSLFVIMLMLSYLLPLERIGSIVVSEKIDERFVVEIDGLQIFFSPSVYNVLKDVYNVADKEFKVCLLGERDYDKIFIDDYYVPTVISSSFVSVTSTGCSEETLISLHSHPSGFCIFSSQDIKSYEQRRNKDAFIGLICSVDRFNFYGY